MYEEIRHVVRSLGGDDVYVYDIGEGCRRSLTAHLSTRDVRSLVREVFIRLQCGEP